jgi:hypothetical protein
MPTFELKNIGFSSVLSYLSVRVIYACWLETFSPCGHFKGLYIDIFMPSNMGHQIFTTCGYVIMNPGRIQDLVKERGTLVLYVKIHGNSKMFFKFQSFMVNFKVVFTNKEGSGQVSPPWICTFVQYTMVHV